jgi:ABC-type multidrug transport system fused ATPase/permease subunit
MVLLSPVIFSIEWRIGLFTIFVGLFSTFGQVLFAKPLAKIAKNNLETTAKATKLIGDIFSGGIIARVFRIQENMLYVFGYSNDRLRSLANREARIDGAQKLVSGISELLTTGGVFVVGSVLISKGDITLTTLMAMVPLCSSVALAIAGFGAAWAGMQAPFEAGQRIYTLLDGNNRLEPLPEQGLRSGSLPESEPGAESQTVKPLEKKKGCAIEVRDLTFTYKDAEKPVLSDVNLSVGANQLAAFVGESGSGKSTLLKVIAGLYTSGSAQVTVNDEILSFSNVKEWRSNFAYVDQNCTLFNLTIAENIGLGREGATLDEIKVAATEANASGFINELPQGYDTPVGEVGGLLSGGQRQRIAIARALIRRSPVLVFDEATSALDAESERAVVDAIHHLRKNHTILLITHNLPAIQPDIIFSVENGCVIPMPSSM